MRESVCVSLLDNHVLHRVCVSARLPRCTFTILEDVHLYILVYVYATCIHFFSRIKRGGCIASVCVCMFACLAVCRCMYLYMERERVFFFFFKFFFPSSLTHKHTHIRTQEGNSCLHIAAAKGNNEILRMLLHAGAKVSAKNKVDR